MPGQPLNLVNTMGSMASRVTRWARENVDTDVVSDAINDAIESLWMAASLATMSKFVGSPVSQLIPANTKELVLASIPDPTVYPQTGQMGGGALPARQYTISFAYVTTSGTHTQESPALQVNVDANTLLTVTPPVAVADAFGYVVFGNNSDERFLLTPEPLPFNATYIEPLVGLAQESGIRPFITNTTGDNIFSIARLDVLNTDGTTMTPWLQSSVNSSAFTQFQNSFPTTATYQQYAYDLIGGNRVEIRPITGTDLTATFFHIIRPRRLAFPEAPLPFTSFASQPYIFRQALSDVLLSLYEDDAAAGWQKKADASKMEVTMSILNESFNQNTTVRAYRPGRGLAYPGWF